MTHNKAINVAAFVADYLGRVGRADSGGISVGGMITQIAEHFGYQVVLLEDTPIAGKTKIDMSALIQQGMIVVAPTYYYVLIHKRFIIALPDPDRVAITDCVNRLYVSADPDVEEGHDTDHFAACEHFIDDQEKEHNGENAFADSLEAFGGGYDDPVSVSVGGPVISKFITALCELATFKELLRSQVERVLIDRLSEFINIDMQNAKESRRRFDKSMQSYDQSREKFVSLKKNAHEDIVAELEEGLQNSKSSFEKSRFNLVHSLMNIEVKKKYEFLESISAIMDAHLRYFKLGYDLLSQMEPYIHQVLRMQKWLGSY
ncbi:ADP-ribosylation factor GTPase-activating protein AGD2-like [Lathyrus oleraceus]|uniref:ADP-ribosylation factor GTPase-activating protein AGD2-like n=1 Tax=Pisum sativum TaxID=3888 RepID=UPI0021D01071|nr:ADP-ribosylation factor GTPase-activating protein AGD2-like [Pisum sativum]